MAGPSRPILGHRQYETLGQRQRRAYDGARQVISHSRREHVSIARAIRDLRARGVSSSRDSVSRYFGNATRRDPRGRLVATEHDPNLRVLNVVATDGVVQVYARGSRSASIAAQHESAVRHYLATGDDVRIREWNRLHGSRTWMGTDGRWHALETDTNDIDLRDQRGEISYEDLYPEVA